MLVQARAFWSVTSAIYLLILVNVFNVINNGGHGPLGWPLLGLVVGLIVVQWLLIGWGLVLRWRLSS